MRLQLVGLAVARRLPAARRGAALGLGDVPHGRRREDPRRLGRVGNGRDRSRRSSSRARSRARSTSVRDASVDARPRRPRPCAHPSRARPRSRSWRRRSTRWRRTSSGSSTPAASSSPGRATTCEHRSRTCRRCSRRSRTVSPSPATTCRRSASRCGRSSLLVDDLFELARIDAGALTLELRATAARRASCRRLPPRRRGRGARSGTSRLDADVDPRRSRAVRARQGRARAAEPADECAASHAVRRRGRRARRRRTPTRCGSTVEDTGDGLGEEAERRMFERFWRGDPARSPRGRRPRARDRARPRRGARRPHLGGEPRGRRRPRLLHASGRIASRHLHIRLAARAGRRLDLSCLPRWRRR